MSGPDVIVIGAGAVGAACASALARSGRRVRVLAARDRSTTAVSGGHLLLQSRPPGPALDLARRSLELVHAFACGREAELEYARRGSLVLAANECEAESLCSQFERLRDAGAPVQWLDGATARELEPGLSGSVTAASYCPLDAQINPVRLADGWLADAAAYGAAIERDNPVQGLWLEGGRVRGVITSGRRASVAAVVLAAGPWSAALALSAGLDLGIRPRRGLLLRGTVRTPLASRPLLGADYLTSKFGDEPGVVAFSFQLSPGGEVVLGGSREFRDFSREGADGLRERILENAARYLPAVRTVEWTRTTVGFRPWSPCGPRIGPCEVRGLYLACGHEGDGITLAAATAELIALTLR